MMFSGGHLSGVAMFVICGIRRWYVDINSEEWLQVVSNSAVIISAVIMDGVVLVQCQ